MPLAAPLQSMRDRTRLGLARAHSRGGGSYRGARRGEVVSTSSGLNSYGRYEIHDWLSLRGIASRGTGAPALEPEGGPRGRVRYRQNHGRGERRRLSRLQVLHAGRIALCHAAVQLEESTPIGHG